MTTVREQLSEVEEALDALLRTKASTYESSQQDRHIKRLLKRRTELLKELEQK